MPKLSFNNINSLQTNCKNCVRCHTIKNGDKEYYECFPVKEYSTSKNAIENCNKFKDTDYVRREVYMGVVVYILYPEFKYILTPIGCKMYDIVSYDAVWKDIKNSNLYKEVLETLNNIGYKNNPLFELIFIAEKTQFSKEWKPITNVLSKEEIKDIIDSLNRGDYTKVNE